ncbi:MAG: HutD family protein [Rubrivivax sp.]
MNRTVLADEVPPVPWKNGGGLTRDLAGDGTPGADDWRWRISLADVSADGPFSAYPGVERWFAVVEGEGVELTLGGVPMVLRPHDPPLVFDGAAAPGCRLLAGPTRDLNLMLRGMRGVMRRAGRGVIWTEDWPLRGHFDIATRTLEWELPEGPLVARGVGYWIGIAP